MGRSGGRAGTPVAPVAGRAAASHVIGLPTRPRTRDCKGQSHHTPSHSPRQAAPRAPWRAGPAPDARSVSAAALGAGRVPGGRRHALGGLAMLEERVGTRPEEILSASTGALRAVARRGGSIAVAQRAERLRTVARRVRDVWKGTLRAAVRQPLDQARRELAKYPSVGVPGAERILLLSGAHPVPGLDSNALRVLQRLGYGREYPQWGRTYRSVQEAAERELPRTVPARRLAYLLLRYHGQTLCRRSAPLCEACPLRPDCPTGSAGGAG